MTVAPAERVETGVESIEALDFELLKSCEHSQHASDHMFHADGGEQYVIHIYPCCGHEPTPGILCHAFLTRPKFVLCVHCRLPVPPHEFYIVLGPVST